MEKYLLSSLLIIVSALFIMCALFMVPVLSSAYFNGTNNTGFHHYMGNMGNMGNMGHGGYRCY